MNKTIEEIIHSVGYTQDGTKANFSFNEAMLIAQRYAQSQTQELQEQNADLVKAVWYLYNFSKGMHFHEGSKTDKEISELLTKYKQLKSNTNESKNKI